jgi:polysaccharide export outer membrane protein
MFTDLITERDQLEVTINDVDPNSPFYQTTERGARSGFVIGPIEVERDGILRLPYLQEIQALGLSLSQLSMIVTKAAREVSPSAEALVRRTARLDKRVFIYGEVDRTGERIIDRENYTLLEALAASGGPSGPPHLFTFVLHRDGLTYNTNVSSLAKQRVFVQDADILKVEQNPDLAFQVTGVIGKPGRYPFPDENPTLMDALSTAQGLDAGYSDARGVFVFRSDGKGGNLIYGVDVSRPDGMFLAQNFSVAPNDIVYISESPVSQWQRAVDLVFPVLDMATRVTTVIRAP